MTWHFWAALGGGIAAAPSQIVNGVFAKIDPAVVAAHTIGRLVKPMGIAVVAVLIL